MAQTISAGPPATDAAPGPGSERPRPRRRLRRALIGLGLAVVVLVGAGAVWFLVGRDVARERTSDEALRDFRSSAGATTEAAGRPDAGVYPAVASGTESVGIPGLDETLGPNAPVTVTHGDGGCFTYRADLNTHHWRTWTFCPTEGTTFALTGAEGGTLRKLPGLDFGSVNTYVFHQPVPFVWPGQAAGDTRQGAGTGTADTIAGVTDDRVTVEVLGTETLTIDGQQVEALHLSTLDTLTGAQPGTEQDEWWIDARTGLPLKLVFDVRSTSDSPVGTAVYTDRGQLELTSLRPAT